MAASVSQAMNSGESTVQDLFALTDEQILDIAPENEAVTLDSRLVTHEEDHGGDAHHLSAIEQGTQLTNRDASIEERGARSRAHDPSSPDQGSRATGHEAGSAPEPPAWLAAQMNDPWSGSEVKEFWTGVQQARSDAAAYRESIATPEDARALKELYPGGVAEARAAAERARTLNDIDRAYFGSEGNSPEQRTASRAQLAQQLLRDDPAAFREMLELGLQAVRQAGQESGSTTLAAIDKSVTAAPAPENRNSKAETRSAPNAASTNFDFRVSSAASSSTDHDPRLAAYAAFERAANDDIERSVGSAIDRALAQALPVGQPLMPAVGREGSEQRKDIAHSESPQGKSSALRERLATGIRSEVEKALQGDRQLGAQIAQILSSRRFDELSRAQVVRLINERAQQLVPGAAKRIFNDWTQTTLAAHRNRSQRNDVAADLAPASSGQSSDWLAKSKAQSADPVAAARRAVILSETNNPSSPSTRGKRVDYKLSDEQILNL